ncbi:MAG: N-formylglutamate amidohydrolase [Alphaproteobacteria bacterium]|nr:N-formylglutamate amidohydrolase [Alphaproteobacteria bacterium]
MSTSIPGVLYVKKSNGSSAPVVFDSPHSGTDYPEDFDCIAPMAVVRKSEDAFVDELYASVPECGASLQAALFPRAYIDPNRSLLDIDPELMDERWPDPLEPSEKTRLGHGLIWRMCPPDYALYDRKLRTTEVRNRIDTYWRPYHRTLRDMLDLAYEKFGKVWHINCHSMPAAGVPQLPGASDSRRVDFVLGDRDGTTCEPAFTALVAASLREFGYHVRVNDPYKGVELVRAHSDPARGRHSLQIEINRALYMDEVRLERGQGFAALQENLTRLADILCHYARTNTA